MTEYLPRLVGQFLIDHRDIDIDLRELDSHDVLSAMHQEQANIGIVADYALEQKGLRRSYSGLIAWLQSSR